MSYFWVFKQSLLGVKICLSHAQIGLVLGVTKSLSHAQMVSFLGVKFKISEEHPRLFHMGVLPGIRPFPWLFGPSRKAHSLVTMQETRKGYKAFARRFFRVIFRVNMFSNQLSKSWFVGTLVNDGAEILDSFTRRRYRRTAKRDWL